MLDFIFFLLNFDHLINEIMGLKSNDKDLYPGYSIIYKEVKLKTLLLYYKYCYIKSMTLHLGGSHIYIYIYILGLIIII